VILPRFAFAKTESPFRDRGTEGSNPAPSSSESAANPTSVSLRDRDRIRPNAAAADERVGGLRRHVAYGNLHGVAYCGRMLPSQIALPVHRVHLASLTLPIWDETKRDERGSHPPCWPARKPRSPLVPVVLNRPPITGGTDSSNPSPSSSESYKPDQPDRSRPQYCRFEAPAIRNDRLHEAGPHQAGRGSG
jgi:hypothetical protein